MTKQVLGIWLLFLPGWVLGQNIIAELELKDFYDENKLYPYDFYESYQRLYKLYDPMVRISDGEFVMAYKPKAFKNRLRAFAKYNILLEEIWNTELELAEDEEIFHLSRKDNNLYILSEALNRDPEEYRINLRWMDLDSGKMSNDVKILYLRPKKENNIPYFAAAPNDSLFAIFNYGNVRKKSSVNTALEFIQENEYLGSKIQNANYLAYNLFDQNFRLVQSDTITLNQSSKVNESNLGCYLDNQGKFYCLQLSKSNELRVLQYNPDTRQTKSLKFQNFPKLFVIDQEPAALLPPTLGNNDHLYLALGEEEKSLRGRGVKEYRILDFDFQQEEVNQTRKAPMNSTHLIQVSKARVQDGLKPITRLIDYKLQKLEQLPDGSLMLYIQKEQSDVRLGSPAAVPSFQFSYTQAGPDLFIEEILIFRFTPSGAFDRMFVVPSRQNVSVLAELAGANFTGYIDPEEQTLSLLLQEGAGERYNDPMRLHLRDIDLTTGILSPRLQLYDNKRRNHFFSKIHILWLNPQLITCMVHTNSSVSTKTMLLTINLQK